MRIGKRKLLLLVGIPLLLLIGMAAFLHSPVGITRLRIQNNLFRVARITVAAEEGGFRDVTQLIEARNLFPWTVTVDRVGFHSKGEYSVLWSDVAADAPFSLGPWETRQVSVAYRFDEARFLSQYAAGWQRERGAPTDPAACVADFLRSDGFIFYSGDIPTGEAYCFTENHDPAYVVE